MMLTEEEAKKTLCCGPLCVAWQSTGSSNLNCEGSACMAWRWGKDEKGYMPIMKPTKEKWTCEHCNGKGKDPKFIYRNPEQPECDNLNGWCYECEGKGSGQVNKPAGYCGLAGRPE